MNASSDYRWQRVSDETRHQSDPANAVPLDVQAQLSEGFLPPHKNIRRAPGVYYYFGHLSAESAAEKRNPKTRLRMWTKREGLVGFEEKWPIGPSAHFDLERQRILVSTASDEDRRIPALYEIEMATRRRRQLEVIDRPTEFALSSAFYLRGGGIAVRSQNEVRVLTRDGDHLRIAAVRLDVGDIVYLGVAGRLVVTPTAIWEIDEHGVRRVATFEPVLATCVQDFAGRVLRYTRGGCELLVGPHVTEGG